MKYLSIYGLQRSGTNYLRALLKNRYRGVRFLNLEDRHHPAHKHFRIYDEKALYPEPAFYNEMYFNSFQEFEAALLPHYVPDFYLVLSKSPYSWYISYLQWASKCSWNTPDYHYIEEYNRFYGKWLEFSQETDKIIFVRYRDLLLSSKEELERINEHLGLSRRLLQKPAFVKITKSGIFTPKRFNYYKHRQYLNQYSKKELQALNNKLDIQVSNRLGYKIVTEELLLNV